MKRNTFCSCLLTPARTIIKSTVGREVGSINLILGPSSQYRSQSSEATATADANINGDYTKKRSNYQQNLTELRKQWQVEFAEKRRLQEEQKQEKQRQQVLEKAVRLREKRQESLLRQEEDRKIRERARKLYLEKLARNHLMWDEAQLKQQQRYLLALEDLRREQQSWITLENMDSRITEELFEQPATTGLSNKYSDYWRTHVQSTAYQMEVDFNPEKYPQKTTGSALEDRLLRSKETKFTKRRIVEEFVEDLVSSGEERERFQEYVNDFYRLYEKAGAFQWVDDGHAAMMDQEDGIQRNPDGSIDTSRDLDDLSAVLEDGRSSENVEFEDLDDFDFSEAELEDNGGVAATAAVGKKGKLGKQAMRQQQQQLKKGSKKGGKK